MEDEEDDLYEAVYQWRKNHGCYDPWYKKIRFRHTRQTTPIYLLPTLTWSPYIKAIGVAIGRHVWQISFNKFI